MPRTFGPFMLHQGRWRRHYRVHEGELQGFRRGSWRKAAAGKSYDLAMEHIRWATGQPKDAPPVYTEVVVDGIRLRLREDGRIERWKGPFEVAFDYGVQKRPGYWRRVPKRWGLYQRAEREFRKVRAALDAAHSLVRLEVGA